MSNHLIKAAESGLDRPWAGLGHRMESGQEYDLEAAIKTGFDFEVEKVKLGIIEDAPPTEVRARALRRKDTKDILCDHVGTIYHLLQPRECFEFFKPYLDEKLASIETAGLIGNGQKIWILAKIKKDPIVLGKAEEDHIDKYVLLSNSYDGNTSIRVGFTPFYIACWNQLALAVKDKASQLIRVRHTKSVKSSLEAIRDVIDLADEQFSATAEQYQRLIRKNINQKDIMKYVNLVFGMKSENMNGQQQRIFDRIIALYEAGRTSDLATNRGTLWGLYNAVTEWISYERGQDQSTRLTSLWFGASARTNDKALESALTMAS